MKPGDAVLIRASDTVYPNAPAIVVKHSTRNGQPYLGLQISEDIGSMTAEVGHVVWRYESALLVDDRKSYSSPYLKDA